MLQMNLYNIFLLFNIVIMTAFSKNVDIKAGLEEPIPFSVGLKFITEINNLNEEDCAVDVYPDECCLHNDDDKCDIIEIMGVASDVIGGGEKKTFTMVAPLLDAYQRRGYCTLYIDSRPVSKVKTKTRHTVKIKFSTALKKNSLPNDVKFCKLVDEDPFNNCNPVDCDIYYNGKKSQFSQRKHRCVQVPACLSVKNIIPETIYNPASNNCDESALSKGDLDYIRELTMNPRRRLTKEVLLLQMKPDSDPNTLPSDDNYDDIETDNILNTVFEHQPTEVRVTDVKALTKQQAWAEPKSKAEAKAKTKSKAKAKAKKKKAKTNVFSKVKAKAVRIHKVAKVLKYLKRNKYTVMILFCVSVMQCCLICIMVYCMTKNCMCGKKTQVVHNVFCDKHDASITTPLIGLSNIDTETTDCQYMSESSNYIDKRIKCYKACQKDYKNNIKMSMSDDIISKYITQRNWHKLPRSETIPEVKTNEDCKITKRVRSDNQSIKKVYNRDYYDNKKPKFNRTITKKDNSNTISNVKQLSDSSERQIWCHNYNVENNSRVSTDTVQNNSLSRLSGVENQKKNKTDSIEKSAQAFFSNDSIDDFLSGKGILCMDDMASKCSYLSISTAAKSQSSKTSKNNIVKNFISLLPKNVKSPSSDPGINKSSTNLDLELLYVSQVSLSSSFESDESKNSRIIRGSSS